VRALLVFGLVSSVGAASGQSIDVTASVELPKPVARSGDAGPFDNGANLKPIVVDAATRAKLDHLAAEYVDVARQSYPMILRVLDYHPDQAPKPVHIVVTYAYGGVAATSGAGFGDQPGSVRIEVSAKYALAHPDDLGMINHEMVHVVQSYPQYDPVWLVEGIADYVRWFFWEPVGKRPHPNPAKATARDSYRTTGAFLYWASTNYNLDLVPKLNAALHSNTYKESLFKDLTGYTLDQLNAEWLGSLKASKQS
jgi:hypothetical protein